MNGEVAKIVGRLSYALRAANQVSAAEPNNAVAQYAAGAVLRTAGVHEKALVHFQRAVELSPDNAQFVHHVGLAQQALGNLEQAEAAFRRAIGLAPDSAQSYFELIQLQRQTERENWVAELERVFALPDPDGLRQLHAGHALAKTYEDFGDMPTAFAWLIKAKAQRGALRPYSVEHERTLAEAAMALAGSQDEPVGFPSEEPVFIVGLPRTGTTLVDRILSSHPSVYSAGELNNLAQIMKAMSATSSKVSIDVETLARAGSIDMEALGRAYVESTRPLTGSTPRFTDKTPVNYLLGGLIRRALPHARTLCLVRDPLDACLSLFRQMFASEHPYYNFVYDLRNTAHAYVNFRTVVARLKQRLPADRYLEVGYEYLVTNFEPGARRMIEFCGLEWDPRCIRFHENPAAVATPSAAQVRRPLYRSAIGRWRLYGALLDPAREVLEQAGLLTEGGP